MVIMGPDRLPRIETYSDILRKMESVSEVDSIDKPVFAWIGLTRLILPTEKSPQESMPGSLILLYWRTKCLTIQLFEIAPDENWLVITGTLKRRIGRLAAYVRRPSIALIGKIRSSFSHRFMGICMGRSGFFAKDGLTKIQCGCRS